jgi:hypothetical protein
VNRVEEVRKLLEVGRGNDSIKFIREQLKSVISLPGDFYTKNLRLRTSESCGKFSDHVKRPRTHSCSAKMETDSSTPGVALKKVRSCEETIDRTLIRSQSAPVMRMDSIGALAGQEEKVQGPQCSKQTTSSCWSQFSAGSGTLLTLLRLVICMKSRPVMKSVGTTSSWWY